MSSWSWTMFINVVILLLLQVASSQSSVCPKTSGCFHTRLHICCYHAKLNNLPRSVTNVTKNLSITKDNITSLSADMFRRNDLLDLETLSLVETGIRIVEARTFEGSGQLRKIIIRMNEIDTIVPYTFEGIPFLSHLDLTYNKISTLSPRAFFGLRMLRWLDLTGNEVTTLSPDMFEGMKLENLTEEQNAAAAIRTNRKLIFSYSSIKTIKPSAFQHLSFTSLELSNYDIYSVSVLEKNMFRAMKDLRNLKLTSVGKIEQGAFAGLRSLVKLYMREIVIHRIDSETFKDLINLRELDVSHFSSSNLKLERGAFKNLVKLVYMRFDFLGIQSISSGVFTGMGMLQILEITKQEIQIINNDVFRGLHSLVELNLQKNEIETISVRSFKGLPKLRSLNLHDNKLKTIDRKIWDKVFNCISNITHLNLDSNLVTDEVNLLKYFPSLRILSIEGNVTRNMIRTASNLNLEHIKISSSMTKIYIDYFKNFNELRAIETEFSVIRFIKPGEFCPFTKLVKLSITFGHLTNIDPGTFYGLKQLKELHLVRNTLNKIQDGVFGRISQEMSSYIESNYSIANNCKTPEGLVGLEVLTLAYGNISYIHPNALIGNVNLKSLDLSFNRIKTLEYVVEVRKSVYDSRSMLDDLTNLKYLALYRNQISTLNFKNFQNTHALHTMTIALNPLKCDCELKKFWLWMEKSHITSDVTPRCNEDPVDWSDILANLSCDVKELPPRSFKINENEDIRILQVYIAPAVLAAIILVGAFGNILLVTIFILNPDMRTGPNVFLMNLTLGDILNLVVNLPLSFVDNISRTWSLGKTMCQIFIFMRDFSVGVSVYSVVALGIQRYVVIVHPLKYREGKFRFFKGCGTYLNVVLVWILAGLFAFPSVLSATLQGNRCLNVATKYGEEYMRSTWTAQLLVYCVIPVGLIIISYTRIAISLKRSARRMPGEIRASGQVGKRRKLAKMVVTLTVVFCVSYLPNFLVRVLVAWSVMEQRTKFTLYTSFVSYCLFFSNTCFNPFALYLMSPKFRELFERYLFFWRKIDMFSCGHCRFTRLQTVDESTN